MNWTVFWSIVVFVPVGTAALVGLVWCCVELEARHGWRWPFPVLLGAVVLACATLFGLTP